MYVCIYIYIHIYIYIIDHQKRPTVAHGIHITYYTTLCNILHGKRIQEKINICIIESGCYPPKINTTYTTILQSKIKVKQNKESKRKKEER